MHRTANRNDITQARSTAGVRLDLYHRHGYHSPDNRQMV